MLCDKLPRSPSEISHRDSRDKIETYLAFGASRMEACRPIAVDALRLALTPSINQMRFLLSS
jgi:ABC-type iron transport system FetAB permease component